MEAKSIGVIGVIGGGVTAETMPFGAMVKAIKILHFLALDVPAEAVM